MTREAIGDILYEIICEGYNGEGYASDNYFIMKSIRTIFYTSETICLSMDVFRKLEKITQTIFANKKIHLLTKEHPRNSNYCIFLINDNISLIQEQI